MRPIIYKVFRYAGAGLDEISIWVLFPFKLLKPGMFWPIIPEALGVLLQKFGTLIVQLNVCQCIR